MRTLLLLITAGVLFVGCRGGKKADTVAPAAQAAVVQPVFEISDTTVQGSVIGTRSFGTVSEGEVAVSGFSVENKTSKAIVVTQVTTDCGCLQIDAPKQPITPSGHGVFGLRYDSATKQGQQIASVRIHTNIGMFVVMLDLFVKTNN